MDDFQSETITQVSQVVSVINANDGVIGIYKICATLQIMKKTVLKRCWPLPALEGMFDGKRNGGCRRYQTLDGIKVKGSYALVKEQQKKGSY